VIGYNDVSVAAELPIPLTTIRSPMHAMGYRSVELVLRLLDGQTGGVRAAPPPPPVLVPRASTLNWADQARAAQ